MGYWDARYAAAFAAFKEKAPAQQREEGILYDWDRMLRPEGYAIIRGRIDDS